ncbi:hypothetical protein CARUB_v10003052mg [Capsella rubella]|uniref:Uncharacterized protein n=1 Tax=Capsella rubella TaxID=81985 RepID=R0HF68_9BRAS|nr:uncharacterized protein LOC17882852 [Capsella rubella]EOA22413.1 hypothetical protein CARUB_v10003052mg [Capsella rubella]
MPPSSATPPPPRGWWSRPIVTFPAQYDRKPTFKEYIVTGIPYCCGILTVIAIMVHISHVVDFENAHCDAKFAIQSIAVSPSSATWHVHFLVKNPSSRYTIYYGDDETAVRLGSLNAAVLKTSHERRSRSHTAFSVAFVGESNPNDGIFKQLDIKLRAKHQGYDEDEPDAGHVDIRCYNLTRNHENLDKIQCYSSFTELKQELKYNSNGLFANSVSISNANASTADWRVGFVARSPATDCKISLQTLKSRLLQGDKVISHSSSHSSGYFGQVFVARDKTNVVFEKVVMPEINGDVIWDFRVEIVSTVNTDAGDATVFMMAFCPDIPVKFTTDPAGKVVVGSLLGNMRRCDYKYQKSLANSLPSS